MKLFHRDFGGEGNPPLVVLHGLLGSSRNWTAVARDLVRHFHVLALDARNHGQSPHAPEHTYEQLADDVRRWLDSAGLEKTALLGHSMGGKTAMKLACDHPDRVEALVVVDISPREKEPSHAQEVAALNALPLDQISSRGDADRILAETISSVPMRQFLLTNLTRTSDGGWALQANVPVLHANIAETGRAGIGENDRYDGPALWIAGGKSDFVLPEDHPKIREHFPRANIEIFENSGHNPHADERARFAETVHQFLKPEP